MDKAIAAGTLTALPAALAEPTAPVRDGWIMLLFLANIGLWLGIYAPIRVLLPGQAASPRDHVAKNGVPSGPLAVPPSVAAGAVPGLVNGCPPLFALAGIVTILAAWTVSRVSSVA